MKKIYLFLFLLTLTIGVFADEGDTIVVQTIDYDTPLMPGWNSPREGVYQFPSEEISFSKILMSYKLICDPSQSPKCGEWDYITYTKIWESTGVFDSTEYTHPKFKINNSAPDTLKVMNSPSFYYLPWLEYSNQITSTNEAVIGSNNSSINLPFGESKDGKAQFIYKTDELISSGLEADNISALVLNLSGDISFKHLNIRLKHFENDTLPVDSLINFGFTSVFEKNISLTDGENLLNFNFPFSWNGTSNILIDISYSEVLGNAEILASTTDENQTLVSGQTDNFLDFSGWDLISVPSEVFETIDTAITISFWQYGDPFKQPMNNSIFYGNDIDGNKVLNVHLPWSNGQIYWDAGWDDGNDRINRSAPHTSDYEGRWNNWTFIKNIESGSMRMYLNGQLFYLGSYKKKTMAGITEFFIGGTGSSNFYEGMIDDFCIWDVELEWPVINEWMNREIDETHPNYENLRAYYKFDEGNGTEVSDYSPHGFNASGFFGQPEWMNYQGENRHKIGIRLNEKPFIKLQNGEYDVSLLDSIVKVDTMQFAANNIIYYNPQNPTMPIDTTAKWPEYYNNYVYDAAAKAIDSSLVNADETFYNETFIYYGEPFEVQNPWEIGRFITPYGNNLSLGDGFTWVYDVTDYASLLHDSVRITAGNFQELLDLEFHMIEGTPARDVLKIDKVYSGNWNLNTFEETVPPKTYELVDGATLWKLRIRTTGHAFDNPTNCAEFCYKTHSVNINNQEVKSWEIIQECAENPLFPQGGTWIYDRAGWCPGMEVKEQDIEISDYVSGNDVTIDYNSEFDEYGNYVLETHLFSYSDYNFNNDAAVVEIIAPNNLKRYGRFNPTATNPIIRIQNLGGENLTSVDISYGPKGADKKIFYWTGNLKPMETEIVTLESFTWNEMFDGGDYKFTVNLLNPNETNDENFINDVYSSKYDIVDNYPSTFVIHLKTNKFPEQNRYEIINSSGEVVFEKDNFESETKYEDTVTLINGCYDFYLYDTEDNGLSFWAESGQGNGSLKFYNLDDNKIKQFNGDFGDRIYNSFSIDMYDGIGEIENKNVKFNISPNPNDGRFMVSYALSEKSDLTLMVHDSQGKQMINKTYQGNKNGNISINMENPASGIYNLTIESEGIKTTQKFIVK
jgi:hypothetical protein